MAVTLKKIADELGVSRMTVSRVLSGKSSGQVSAAVAEKVKAALERHHYCPNLNARNLRNGENELPQQPDNTITLLLPCPDFQSRPRELIASCMEIANGMIQKASEYGAAVKIVPVSRTNNPQDIEWLWLKDLGHGSRVFAFSPWFLPVLMELNRRGCRIAMVNDETFWCNAYDVASQGWSIFTNRVIDGGMRLTRYLLENGCKTPAVATMYANEPDEPLVKGYLAELAEKGCDYSHVIRIPEFSNMRTGCLTAIADAYKKQPFDSLVLHYPSGLHLRYDRSLQANIGIPEEVKIVLKNEHDDALRFSPHMPFMRYPWKTIGRDVAESLLNERFEPGETFYCGELILNSEENAEQYLKSVSLTEK